MSCYLKKRVSIFWQIPKQGKIEHKQFKYVVLHIYKLDNKHIARYVVNKVFTSYHLVRQRLKNVTVISMGLGDIWILLTFLQTSQGPILTEVFFDISASFLAVEASIFSSDSPALKK